MKILKYFTMVLAISMLFTGCGQSDSKEKQTDNKAPDFGTITTEDGKYEGDLKDGKFDGKGTFTFNSGEVYEGEFKDNKFNGQGNLTLNYGYSSEGEFKDGEYHGFGTFSDENGDRLKTAAVCCFVISAIALVYEIFGLWLYHGEAVFLTISFMLIFVFLIAGLICLVMSALFRQAAEMKAEQDLTL